MPHLPPTHHEITKQDYPNEQSIKVKQSKRSRFKFKHHQVNDSSQSNQETDHLVSQKQFACDGLTCFVISNSQGDVAMAIAELNPKAKSVRIVFLLDLFIHLWQPLY
jgi:hypothetical protein